MGTVTLGQSTAVLRGPYVISLSGEALATLMQRQVALWEKAAATLRDLAQGLKGATLSLDGHIGLVGLLLNGVSVVKAASDAKADWSDWGTRLAFMDSSAGTFGGLAQVAQSALSSSAWVRANCSLSVGRRSQRTSGCLRPMPEAVQGASNKMPSKA